MYMYGKVLNKYESSLEADTFTVTSETAGLNTACRLKMESCTTCLKTINQEFGGWSG